ncbi:MerR family transcriptional regulator [Eleftheria terrae]|uniref:MerR family transcriptional regulator n=1 Tax=Eleftheria terrae TaxID=1597781 RepID=UPI00263AAB91|nr:MerR family transcriptional regulator [Eleftheria terrae]WKB54714.1 MerR family transcriptional regulator [Eleftheria terrae]
MRIGELARHAGLTVRTLHHYDAIGLLRPSARSEGGYRLYQPDDVARLHAIQALRHLGLSLDEVGRLLDEGGASLPCIVEQQIHAIDREIAQATQLRQRLMLLREKFSAGHVPEMGDWLASLHLMTTCDKYFTNEELHTIFGQWRLIASAWPPLMQAMRRAMEAGVAPESPEAQPLMVRWMSLMGIWMKGDFDLIRRWGEMYKREPEALRGNGPDPRMLAYVERGVNVRLELLGKYMSLAEMQRLALLPQAEWDTLVAAATELAQSAVPAEDERVRALARRWMGLMDRVAGHDRELRDRLLLAYRNEPVLAAGAALPPVLRAYLHAALVAPLDPVAA